MNKKCGDGGGGGGGGGGGVGGFFLACEDFLENVRSFMLHFAFFFFFKVESSTRTLIPVFRPGSVHGGSASRDDCG